MRCLCVTMMLFASGTLWCAPPERVRIDLRCVSMGAGPTLDCELTARSGMHPLADAPIRVSAHMPSMPMAHRVAPVVAAPGTHAGEYRVRLELEMPGVWAIEFDLTAPRRDKLVRRVRVESCAQPTCPARVLR